MTKSPLRYNFVLVYFNTDEYLTQEHFCKGIKP